MAAIAQGIGWPIHQTTAHVNVASAICPCALRPIGSAITMAAAIGPVASFK
jgi:hypothetical protein